MKKYLLRPCFCKLVVRMDRCANLGSKCDHKTVDFRRVSQEPSKNPSTSQNIWRTILAEIYINRDDTPTGLTSRRLHSSGCSPMTSLGMC